LFDFCLFVDGDEKEKSLLRLLKSLTNISLSIHVRERIKFLCVNSSFFALLCACIYRSLCLEASQTKTAVLSLLKTAHVLMSLLLDAQALQKNMLFQVKNVLKNILFFLAI
jgi:spore maturation protein SpmA